MDFNACYRAVRSRDARFDGRFYTAVTSTGIYCRPSCPARTPQARNVRFYTHAASAEQAGFRPCRRCRPEVSPDAPDWNVRADLVGRALRLVAAGVVDAEGVAGLARRLAVSERHLHRCFVAEVGTGPLAVARTRRLQLARQLLEQTRLPVTQVAFAAGFRSVRQFNAAVRAAAGLTPTRLRAGTPPDSDELTLRLAYRPPLAIVPLLAFLGARAVPGVEEVTGDSYRRTFDTGSGGGVLQVRAEPGRDHLRLTVRAEDLRGLAGVVHGARRLFDLSADPQAVDAVLAADPLLAAPVARQPGLRVPGTFDGFELAVRAVLGQHVSVAAARTLAGRLVRAVGRPLDRPAGGLTHRFPQPAAVAQADLSSLGVTGARAKALRALAAAVADGRLCLDGSQGRAATRVALLAVPGVGPWTADCVALRALGDPDAFPEADLGLRRALARDSVLPSARELRHRAEAWRPWRSYAALHLWTADPIDPARKDAA